MQCMYWMWTVYQRVCYPNGNAQCGQSSVLRRCNVAVHSGLSHNCGCHILQLIRRAAVAFCVDRLPTIYLAMRLRLCSNRDLNNDT